MIFETTGRPRPRRLLLTLSALALAVAGCHRSATTTAEGTQPATAAPLAALPLATAAPPELAPAPVASALPWPAHPIRISSRPRYDRYDYVDRAYGLTYAFADAPPDYTVDYDGEYPWIWRAGDGAFRIVEWLPYGERDYYYEPGEAYPFYVVDPDYGYAYDDGELIGLYDLYGDPLDDGYARDRAYYATRYFDRGHDLYDAAIYRPRRAAYAEDWLARRDDLFNGRRRWERQQARDPGWRAFRQQHAPDQFRQWRNEHNQRMTYAIAAAAGLGPVRDRMRREHRQGFALRGGRGDGREASAPFRPQGGGAFRQITRNRARAGRFGEQPFLRQRQMAMPGQRLGGWAHGPAARSAGMNRRLAHERLAANGRFANQQPFRRRQATTQHGRGQPAGRGMRFDRMQQRYAGGGQPRVHFADRRVLERRSTAFGPHPTVRFGRMHGHGQTPLVERAARPRAFGGQSWRGMRAQLDRAPPRHGGFEMQHRQQIVHQARPQMRAPRQQVFAGFSPGHGGGGGGHWGGGPQRHGGGGGGGGSRNHGGGGGGHGGGAPQWHGGGGHGHR